jgi:hypothetical protein
MKNNKAFRRKYRRKSLRLQVGKEPLIVAFFKMGLGFELRTSCLQSRHSIA